MLERMFLFTKTATKFETISIVALILGLTSFLAPSLMLGVAMLAAVVTIWMLLPIRFIGKILVSTAVLIAMSMFLSSVIYLIAITLATLGVVGVASLTIRFVRSEITYIKAVSEAEEAAEKTEEEKPVSS